MISIHFLDEFSGILIFVLMCFYSLAAPSNGYSTTNRSNLSLIYSLCVGIVFIYLFGNRNYNAQEAGDSWLYAYYYESVEITDVSKGNEWLWKLIIQICRDLGFTTSGWFTIIASLYIIPVVLGCYKICRNNTYVLFISFIGSFLFLSNGFNGIRNGVACSLAFWAISYAMTAKSKFDFIKCAILCILSYGFHNASIMLTLPLITSLLFIKSVKIAITIWCIAIMTSLLFGNSLATFVAEFGEDDRAMSYLQAGANANAMAKFSKSGFRLDFLIYSSIPIIIGYYETIVRHRTNPQYRILLVTYIISNAIWVIFIRAAYSNRFAMLSWFIYPFVLIYPFVKFKRSEINQISSTKQVLWFQYIITLFLRYL